jgi:hypothetical protein
VDPEAGLDNFEKRKIPYSAKIKTADCPACILVTTGTQLSNIMVISNLHSSQTFRKCIGMTVSQSHALKMMTIQMVASTFHALW